MAAINDLINQIEDKNLRERIQAEVDRLTKHKKFGLVFENHIPESTPLYGIPIKRGSLVARKNGNIQDSYIVTNIKSDIASCYNKELKEISEISISDLVCIAQFGEPIYPNLIPIDKVKNAPEDSLWHTLIEADNYHALQLLEYLYAGKVDCIYIDPPYNSGARDWKYNNDYVEKNDSYRHSKWLSMIEKRLNIAKRLLNPKNSVLIVTIDEKEYLHLGCLLEQIFPEALIQMVTIVHNPGGAIRVEGFNRINEYAFYVFIGECKPLKIEKELTINKDSGGTEDSIKRSPIWRGLLRGGANPLRSDSPLKFYPVLINLEGRVVGCGDPLPLDAKKEDYIVPEGLIACWPIKKNDVEGRWEIRKSTFEERLSQGYVKAGEIRKDGSRTIYYLRNAEIERIDNGELISHGVNELGYLDIDYNTDRGRAVVPRTVWNSPSHNATEYGSNLLKNILLDRKFPYPKSLYAESDSIAVIVKNNPNALILDFFAGSGTTLHAVNLLNAEDGGHRRCIMVTNNEVSSEEAEKLTKQGYQPGDPKWEKFGIAQYVTWPRTVCSIEGHDIKGVPLKGNYMGSDIPMADGFKANCEYFKLGFLDKNEVALGRQFKEILPLLWLKAGAIGERPEVNSEEIPDMMVLPKNHFAVLAKESRYLDFEQELENHPEITTVYVVTDSESSYREIISGIKVQDTYQLYRDYLDNFRINSSRR